MSLEEDVHHVAKYYLFGISFGVVPVFIYSVLRSFIEALGKTRITMIITLISLPINMILNYVLIFGELGFPRLGGIGAGIASAITYWIITLIAIRLIYRQKPFNDYRIFLSFPKVDLRKWKEIFFLGIPIGLSIFIETSIFSAVTLLMSQFGTKVIAAYQASINFATLLYMIPLSISMTLTILVGFEVGAKRERDARSYSFLGIASALVISSFLGIFLYMYRFSIATLYSGDQMVVNLTGQFLLFAVFFQLSDAIQAPIQGALRGYKDVNITLIMSFISFWVIGLPCGYLLANYTGMGPFGYWLGLIAGLTVGAITLSFRLIHVQNINKSKKNEAVS